MEKANKALLAETEKLTIENAQLQQKLRDIEETLNAIRTGNIDALVIAREQALKVYTETTADKPYRILIEKMHEGAVTINEEGIIIYCNSSFATIVNLPLQKVIGTIFENYIDDSSKKHIEALRENGTLDILKEEVYLYASGGKEISMLMSANALWLDAVFVVNIILTDLTLQNENKENLKRRSKQLEEKNKELESANKELAFQFDEKGKRAAELDIANKELAFQNEEKEKRAAELAIANKELAFQNEEKDKRASELGIANKNLALQNEEKEKRAAELIITNEELQQLLQLNADKDRFISILAHDLRSPFSSILGFLLLLSDNIRSYTIKEIEEHIKIINQSAQNTYNLLEDLILWTMSQSGKLPYEPQKLIFNEVCKEVMGILKSIANAKNITLNYFIPEEITVFADINMLKTVLRNLVSNAIKFTNPGGRIDIYARKSEANITISVSDNGIGMEPENVQTLFDISKTQTTKGTGDESGTGLGLFLCKEFIEKHGGKIWVESEVGKGSEFKFTLPCNAETNDLIVVKNVVSSDEADSIIPNLKIPPVIV
jgi:signal transduction histidine kinase